MAFAASVIMMVFYKPILSWLTKFTERNIITYDGVIDPNQYFIIEIALMFFICLEFFVGAILTFNWHKKVSVLLNSIFDIDKLQSYFLVIPLLQKRT